MALAWEAWLTNPEDVYRGAVLQMPSVVERAVRAGAQAPLMYVGTGMTAVVLCDRQRGYAFKVARQADDSHFLDEEAEWLAVASKTPGVREHVAKLFRYHPREVVIQRECPMPTEDYGVRRQWTGGHQLFDLHYDVLGKRMLARGWTAPEFKSDSYVITDHGPILVDASMPSRVGKVLLRYVVDKIRGRRPPAGSLDRPSDDAFYVRREVREGTISAAAAAPVLQTLALLEAHGNRWP